MKAVFIGVVTQRANGTRNIKSTGDLDQDDKVSKEILAARLSKKYGKLFTAENLGIEIAAYLDEMHEKIASLKAKTAQVGSKRDFTIAANNPLL